MSKEIDKSNPLPASPELPRYFQTATEEIWREAAEKLLKGKSFDKTLRTDTIEGFTLEPIYHTAAKAASEAGEEYPGLSPFTRGSNAGGNSRGWFTAQRVQGPSVVEANSIILEGLQRGENAVCLSVSVRENQSTGAISLNNLSDLQLLLHEVDLSAVPLYCYCDGAAGAFAAGLARLLTESGRGSTILHGWLLNDPLTQLAVNGQLPASIEKLLDDQAVLHQIGQANFPRFKVLGVDMRPWHNAGASAVQELGISLAIGAHYLRNILGREDDSSASDLLKDLQLAFAVGSDFFMEIAKLRAARLLWHRMISSFDEKPPENGVAIHCETSTWNKTIYDPHVNMLRTTTEAMSAIMGGCESLTILPFDEIITGGNSFSRRVARNTHHLLREESGFHQVIDPAGGSPYVENLTRQLAEEAWGLFRDIEYSGGIADAVLSGEIQKKVAVTAAEREKRVSTAKAVFVGTNRYANAAEKGDRKTPDNMVFDDLTFIDSDKTLTWLPPLQLSDEGAFEKLQDALVGGLYFAQLGEALGYAASDKTNSEITPLQQYRGAEVFEALRARTEQLPEELINAAAALVCLGKPAEYRTRADYADGILAVGGLKAERIVQLESIGKAAEALGSVDRKILVFCSSDAVYADWIPQLLKRLDKHTAHYFLLAGKPGEHEAGWRKAGIDSFIHLGCNVIEELMLIVKTLEDAR